MTMRRITQCWLVGVLIFIVPVFNSDANTDTIKWEAFMDGVIQTKMHDEHIAGTTTIITHNGIPVVKKGYGYADVEAKIKVDPDTTLFRIGSISKLFVWISVMQLYEQGKLELDTDINQYLKAFEVPDFNDEPITMKLLMSHTPGFEDHVIELFTSDTTTLKPLGEILEERIPLRVYPPGQVASYSNHGTALAAHIVEIISDMDWHDYVQQNILDPLKLNNTTFNQPLPDALASQMSKGYASGSGQFYEKSFELVPMYAVGAASTTASDMGRFMQALLNYGELDGARILDSTTVKKMFEPLNSPVEGFNSMCYGFMEHSQFGQKIYGHGGDTFWFHSLLVVIPEENIGFFISFNTNTGTVYSDVLESFVSQFLKGKKKEYTVSEQVDLSPYTGEYHSSRYSHSTITKIAKLFSSITISAVDSNRLELKGSGEISYWYPIGDHKFVKERSEELLGFKLKNNKAEQLHFDGLPIITFLRVPFYEKSGLQLFIFIITLLSLIVVVKYWPISRWLEKRYHKITPINPVSRNARWLAWSAAFLSVIFVIGIVIIIIVVNEDLVYGIPLFMKVILSFPMIILLLTIMVWVVMFYNWTNPEISIRSKLFYTWAAIALALFHWQLSFWNMIGYHF